jgi:hypothetical protein
MTQNKIAEKYIEPKGNPAVRWSGWWHLFKFSIYEFIAIAVVRELHQLLGGH